MFVAGLGTGGTLMGVAPLLAASTSRGSGSTPPSRCPGENVQGLRSLDEGFVPGDLRPDPARREVPRARTATRSWRCASSSCARGSSPGRRAGRSSSRRRGSPRDGRRHDRRAAARRRLEIPVGRHVLARPRRDGGRPRGRRQLVVTSDRAQDLRVSAGHPGRRRSPCRRRSATRSRPRAARVPERGLRDRRRRPAPPPRAAGACASSRPATPPPRRSATGSTRTTCSGSTIETDDADEVFWAIVHSQSASPARPSPTDIGLALYPDALYILVSLADAEAEPGTGEPGIRAWRIVDGPGLRGGADGLMATRWIRALVPLAAGLLALIVGTAFGWDARLLDALVSPPALVRAALVAGSTSARDLAARPGRDPDERRHAAPPPRLGGTRPPSGTWARSSAASASRSSRWPRSPPPRAGSWPARCRSSWRSSSPGSTSSRRRSCCSSSARVARRSSPRQRRKQRREGRARSQAERRADPGRGRRLEAGRPQEVDLVGREDRRRWTVGHDLATAHDDDPFEMVGGELHVVGDRDDGPARAGKGVDDRPDAARPRDRPGRSSARRGRGRPGPSPARSPARRASGPTGRGRTGWSARFVVRPTAASAAVDEPRPSCRPSRPRLRGPKATSRSTDRSNSWSSGFWNTNPTGRGELVDGPLARVRPSSGTRPAVGRSRPLRCFTSVVLPEPFWPTIATASPGLDLQVDAPERLDATRVAVDEPLDGDPAPAVAPGRRRPVAERVVVGPADRARRSDGRVPGSAAGDRRLVEGLRAGRSPAASASADERRRRSSPIGSSTGCRAPRPGTSSARSGPGRGRDSGRSRRGQRVVLRAQDRGPVAGQLGQEVARRPSCRPGRAGRSAHRGRGRRVPIATMLAIATRCCSPPDSANGSRSARCAIPSRPRTASIRRVHLVARDSRGSRARRRAPRGPWASRPRAGWPASRTRSRPARASVRPPAVREVDVAERRRPVELRPDDPRDEPGRERGARVDLPAPVRPATPTRSPGRDRQVDVGQRRLAPPDVAARARTRVVDRRAGAVDGSRSSAPSRSAAPAQDPANARTTTPTIASDDQPGGASDRSAGRRRPDTPSGPAARRTRAPRARTSARGRR